MEISMVNGDLDVKGRFREDRPVELPEHFE